MPKSHRHKPAGCPEYADWQAEMQVELAQQIVLAGRAGQFRRDKTVFGQVVQVLAGQRADISGIAPFTNRLRAALAGYQSEMPTVMEGSDAD